MFLWMRLANRLFPKKNLPTSIKKALMEQIVYDPWAISAFLFVMTLLEGKTTTDAKFEVGLKCLIIHPITE